jgi:hypothetical protein
VRCRARNGRHLGVFQRIAVVANHLHIVALDLVALDRGANDQQFAVLDRRVGWAHGHAHSNVMVEFSALTAGGGGKGFE